MKKTEILRNMVAANLSIISGMGMFMYKASPVHCRSHYRIGHTLGQIINNCEIWFLVLSPPPKHKPAIAERGSVNHCLKFSQLNQGRVNVISMLLLEFIPSLDTAKPTQLGMTHLHGFIKYFWKGCVLSLECSGLHQEYVMLQHGGSRHPWLFPTKICPVCTLQY